MCDRYKKEATMSIRTEDLPARKIFKGTRSCPLMLLFIQRLIWFSIRSQVVMVYKHDEPLGMLEEHSKNS